MRTAPPVAPSHRNRPHRLATVLIAAGALVIAPTIAATTAGAAGTPTASTASSARLARVVGDAAHGGPVIVWLRNQHATLNLPGVTVTKAATTISLTLSKATVKHGTSESVTVAVGGHAGARYPSGKITVKAMVRGKTTLTTITIHQPAKGNRTLTITLPNKTGTGQVVASYGGDANFTASASAPQSVRVV